MDVPSRRNVFRSLGAALLAGSGCSSLFAQDVIDPAPTQVPVRVYSGASGSEATGLTGGVPLVWGPFKFQPHVSYTYTYSDAVRSRPGELVSTSRHRISPGVRVNLGERWSADYTISWNDYNNESFQDTVEHALRFSGGVSSTLWSASLSHTSSWTNSPLIETARQTEQEQHGTTLRFARTVSTNLAVELDLEQRLRYVEDGPNSYDHSATPGLSYRFSPAFIGHAGVAFGETEVTGTTPDMRYQRPQVGFAWQLSSRLSANAFTGWERRKFIDSDAETQTNPVYGASVAYRPFAQTSVTVYGTRQTGASYFSNLISEGETWGVDVSQRLFLRYQLGLGAAWSDYAYSSTVGAVVTQRTDERTTYYARLGTDFLRNGSVGVGWRRNENDSTAQQYSFNSDQYTVDVSYSF